MTTQNRWFVFRDYFLPLKSVLGRIAISQSSLKFVDVFHMWAQTKMLGDDSCSFAMRHILSIESVSFMKMLTFDKDFSDSVGGGWHTDREHVARPPPGSEDNVGMVLFNIRGFSSTVQFRLSPRSGIHEIVVPPRSFYLVRGPWFRAVHRFKADGPRVVARIGIKWVERKAKLPLV
jgi:hypothetical protein